MTENTQPQLDNLSVDELDAIEKAAHAKKVEKQRVAKDEVIAQIVDVARAYAVTGQEIARAISAKNAEVAAALSATKKNGGALPAKYRDPVTGRTWAGRGKLPAFIRDSGKDRVHFLIPAAK